MGEGRGRGREWGENGEGMEGGKWESTKKAQKNATD